METSLWADNYEFIDLKEFQSGGFTVFYIYGTNKENNVNVISS